MNETFCYYCLKDTDTENGDCTVCGFSKTSINNRPKFPYQKKKKHMEMIADCLRKYGTIVFSYTPDDQSEYPVFISKNFEVLNTLSFGGNPRGRYYVGLPMLGSMFHFEMDENKLHPDYVAEKLHLDKGYAKHISELLIGISKELK